MLHRQLSKARDGGDPAARRVLGFYIARVPTPIDSNNRPDPSRAVISASRTSARTSKRVDCVCHIDGLPLRHRGRCSGRPRREERAQERPLHFLGYSPSHQSGADKEHTF